MNMRFCSFGYQKKAFDLLEQNIIFSKCLIPGGVTGAHVKIMEEFFKGFFQRDDFVQWGCVSNRVLARKGVSITVREDSKQEGNSGKVIQIFQLMVHVMVKCMNPTPQRWQGLLNGIHIFKKDWPNNRSLDLELEGALEHHHAKPLQMKPNGQYINVA